jgi:hypothetical protein
VSLDISAGLTSAWVVEPESGLVDAQARRCNDGKQVRVSTVLVLLPIGVAGDGRRVVVPAVMGDAGLRCIAAASDSTEQMRSASRFRRFPARWPSRSCER